MRQLVFVFVLTTVATGFLNVAQANARKDVYLLRGLFNVFSTGLDELATKLKRRRIMTTAGNHSAWSSYAKQAIENYKKRRACTIVIIGHSLGADAAISMARELRAASVPVALIVTFGPFTSQSVPANVSRLRNYYRSNSSWNNVYTRQRRSKTVIRNIDLASKRGIDHFNIEKLKKLHKATMRSIRRARGRCRRR